MAEWFAFAPAVLVAVAVVFVPGLALSYGMRLRGALLWGFAPAAGVGALGVSAVALGIAGIAWSPVTAAIAVVAMTGVAWAVMLPLRTARTHEGRGWRAWVAGAVMLGAVIGAVRMASIIGAPDNVSQTNDATFHLNALRYIADTGSASSLDILGTTGGSGFYPAAWHAVASLTMQITGSDVVVAANATSLAIAGPIWAASIAGLVWVTTRDATATAVAALLAPTLFAFPFHMLDFGVLYPYALAIAVLPGVIAVLVASVDEVSADPASRGRIVRVALHTGIVTVVGLGALGLAQPSSVLVWVIAAAAWGLVRLLAPWPSATARDRWMRAAGSALLLGAATGGWLAVVSISSENLWPGIRNLPDAAARMLINGSVGAGPAVFMSVLAGVGLVVAVRSQRLRWLALFSVALAILVLVAQSVQNDTVRMLLSPWYADPRRFTAMMPLVVVPLAAIGVAAIARWRGWREKRSATAAVIVVIALVYLEAGAWAAANPQQSRYGETEESYLSADERALLDDLDEYVAPDARVIGNPSAGAAFGYGLSGVDVVPRTWSMPTGADFQVLREDLADLTEDPDVCPAIDALGVDYVLDFGDSEDGPGKWEMPGLTGFSEGEAFELVAERGDASLWRIAGCD